MSSLSDRSNRTHISTPARRRWVWVVGLTLLALAIALPLYAFDSTTSSGNAVTKGGTLFLVGTGDVDFMDPNVAYYNPTYLVLRAWSRQLYSYPATPGRTADVVPDLATEMPTISADGLSYTFTIVSGATWDTSPHRQVTAADALRGLERTCNP